MAMFTFENLHIRFTAIWANTLFSFLSLSFFFSITLEHCFSGEVGMGLNVFDNESNTKNCVTKIY